MSALQDAGGYAISRQNNLELHLGCHTLLIELFCIGMHVGRTDGRWSAVGRVDKVKVDLLTHGAPLRARES